MFFFLEFWQIFDESQAASKIKAKQDLNVLNAQVHFEKTIFPLSDLLDWFLEPLVDIVELHQVFGFGVHPIGVKLIKQIAVELMKLLDGWITFLAVSKKIVEMRLSMTVFQEAPGHVCDVDSNNCKGVAILGMLRMAQ